jgi:C-terminal processing protease CtpA/Prc
MNENSASASEILAAVQDNDRGTVGRRSLERVWSEK